MARPPKTLPSDEPAALSPDEIVRREEPQRMPAVIAAGVSVAFTVIAVILEQLLSSKVPDFHQSDLVQTMGDVVNNSATPKSFLTAVGNFKIDHASETVILSGLRGLAFVLMIPILLLILRAARARGGTLGKFLEPVLILGFVLLAFGTILAGILEPAFYRDARDHGFTPGEIREAYQHSSLVIASIPLTIGALAAGVPLALASIQSYRVGLMPTYIGYMGVLVGMLFILPFEPTGILRAFWFSLVAATIAGGMRGLPEAWSTGVAVLPSPRAPRAPRGPAGGAKPKAAAEGAAAAKPKAGAAGGGKGKGPKLTK